jgi:signal transduction histidine kinase
MSLSLIGIIFVQSFWIKDSIRNKDEQFTLNVKQILSSVSQKIQKREKETFLLKIQKIVDSIGIPDERVLNDMLLYQNDNQTNDIYLYRSGVIEESYNISNEFFDSALEDSINVKRYFGSSYTAFFNENDLLDNSFPIETKIEWIKKIPEHAKPHMEDIYYEISKKKPIHKRLSPRAIRRILDRELYERGISIDFEYAIYSNDLATKVKSDAFDDEDGSAIYEVPIFMDKKGNSNYQLRVNFPDQTQVLLGSVKGMGTLSIIFTLVIIIAYWGAISQLIKQRKISEIKTDFINNMTHEFKTPIATINLALDAIKNPKTISDQDKVKRYLNMIREENKRMHAQVENVLRISKLEKNQLEIKKERLKMHDLLEDALTHVELIVADRQGYISTHFEAKKSSILANDVHFVNVLVNILDNAIKYSPDAPKIDVYTENVKEYIILKIKDHGSGMTKSVQKKIFEKFYREHTGNIHNVKGHGLGLAYVKRIIDDHNGFISVESEKGKGSTFIIKIPLIS